MKIFRMVLVTWILGHIFLLAKSGLESSIQKEYNVFNKPTFSDATHYQIKKSDFFWPFSNSSYGINVYDLTELIVYIGIPILIYMLLNILRNRKRNLK